MEAGEALTVAALGAVVRSYRKASGLSQKDLAKAAGVSRATLNYLESAREDIEIGAGKLFALLSVLGVPIGLPESIDRQADERRLSEALSSGGSGKTTLTEADLVEALASGRARPGSEVALSRFLASASPGLGAVATRVAAARSGSSAKDVARHGQALAKELGVQEGLWHSA